MFREISFGSRHIGKEQPTNILQAFLNEFLNLSKPSIKPPAISREEFFADILEFPFALPSSSSNAADLCPSAMARAKLAINAFSFPKLNLCRFDFLTCVT